MKLKPPHIAEDMEKKASPLIIGLTGVFGSGKSTVARYMAEAGGRVIDADDLAREVTTRGSEGLNEIARAFGPEMINVEGELDRQRMGALVFADRVARERLNAIVHPRVQRKLTALIAAYQQEDVPFIVLDVPLLYEVGLESLAHTVIVVTADEDDLLRRLAEKRGLSVEQARSRLSAQFSQDEKSRRADHVLQNTGSSDNLKTKTLDLLRKILAH